MGSANSRQLFPGCEELLLHPAPARVAAMPPHEMIAFIAAQLDEQAERPHADLEETMGLGQLARLLSVEGVEAELEHWLQHHPTPRAYDTAALFLAGFWASQRAPSAALVDALIRFLDGQQRSIPIVDTVVLPLHAAFLGSDPLLRATIAAALRPLLPLYPLLQRASQEALSQALDIPADELTPRPKLTDFSARAPSDGTPHFVIEHIESQREVVRVHGLTKHERTLRIDYEVLVCTLTQSFVHQLIARCVLLELCNDAYRGRATRVQYVNCSTQASKVEPYPPRPPAMSREFR